MTGHKSFGSDNHAGAHPEVVAAIVAANIGDAGPYGADDWTSRAANELVRRLRRGRRLLRVQRHGGQCARRQPAAPAVRLGHLRRVIALHVDECGATERNLGNKVATLPTPDGKLTPELIAPRLTGRGDEHRVQARVVEIAQVTELGTCYSLDELRRLSEFCRAEGLYLFIDGARLANAVAYLDCELADIAAHADVLSFGGTKNGAVAAESVIVMRDELISDVLFLRKQQMQLGSKMRFMAAQFTALLDDKLWLRSAQHANAMAARLADGLADMPGVTIRYPVQSNAVFAALNPERIKALQQEWTFYTWDESENVVRWMTAFDTTEEDVEAFLESIRASAAT